MLEPIVYSVCFSVGSSTRIERPTSVKIFVTVSERIGDQILEYIGDLEPGDKFTVNKIAERFDSSVTEFMLRTFPLGNIGKDEEPEYVVNTTGSGNATD
jgi:hypothetical protein